MNGTSPSGIPSSLPGLPTWFKVSIAIVAILGAFGNGIVIYLIATRHQLRTKTNFMVSSLAVSDILVILVLIPSFLVCLYFKCDNRSLKILYDGFLYVSVCNLCCITLDRYLAVTRPLKYRTRIIRLPVKTMITISWILPTTISLVPIIWSYSSANIETQKVNNKIYYTIQVVLFMCCPCLIMLIAYAVIFNIARKKIQHIRREIENGVIASTIYSNSISASSAREGKASLKVFGTVVVMFVACWSLTAFRTIVMQYKLMEVSWNVTNISRLLLVANSAINPFIYALWKNDINKEINKLFRRVLPLVKSRPVTVTSGNNDLNNRGLQDTAIGLKIESADTKCEKD